MLLLLAVAGCSESDDFYESDCTNLAVKSPPDGLKIGAVVRKIEDSLFAWVANPERADEFVLLQYEPGADRFAKRLMFQSDQPATFDSEPSLLLLDGDMAYFAASTLQSGRELWRADLQAGTPAEMLFDLKSGVANSNPAWALRAGEKIYFGAYGELSGEFWAFDLQGEPAPYRVGEFTLLPYGNVKPAVIDGRLYTAAEAPGDSYQMWTIDPETDMLERFSVRWPNFDGLRFSQWAEHQGIFFFNAPSRVNGNQLWAFDPRSGQPPFVLLDSAVVKRFFNAGDDLYIVLGLEQPVSIMAFNPALDAAPRVLVDALDAGNNMALLGNVIYYVREAGGGRVDPRRDVLRSYMIGADDTDLEVSTPNIQGPLVEVGGNAYYASDGNLVKVSRKESCE